MSEFRYAKPGWELAYLKRDWVPEWLYALYSKVIPPWMQPFRWIFNRKVREDE